MSGPNSFIQGTQNRLGEQFDVPIPKAERKPKRSIIESAQSARGRERIGLKTRLRYQKVTSPYPMPEENKPLDCTGIMAARNKLIGLAADYKIKNRGLYKDLQLILEHLDRFILDAQ